MNRARRTRRDGRQGKSRPRPGREVPTIRARSAQAARSRPRPSVPADRLPFAVSTTAGVIASPHEARLIRALQQDLSTAQDDRMAIDVLVAALSAEDPEKRALAHKHLVRLTGRTFPPDAQPWLAWWKSARPTWGNPAPGAAAGTSGTQGPAGGDPSADL